MPQVVFNCPLVPQQISRAGPAADKRAFGANDGGDGIYWEGSAAGAHSFLAPGPRHSRWELLKAASDAISLACDAAG